MNESDNKTQYRMKIQRTIVDDLGLKLYDKISAVVAEIISNSYDADAENVTVKLPLGKMLASKNKEEHSRPVYAIEISDDGHGMTPSEANKFYLAVGKHRRDDSMQGDRSRRKKRRVMGRKGLGKLAPFGVCRAIEIRSAGGEKNPEGFEVTHFQLNYDDMVSQEPGEKDYSPEPLEDDKNRDPKSGTKITLKNFLPKKVPDKETFSRQLSYRFGLGRNDFEIEVVDNKENPEKKFSIKEVDIPTMEGTKIDLSKSEPVTIDGKDGEHYPVTGWIGMAKKSHKNEELAGVRIYVRGKIAALTRDFGISTGFKGEFVVRTYLVGELHADWLDEKDDLIQTHRQDILWSSELGQALSKWGQEIIKKVADKGREPRRKLVRDRFFKISKLKDKASKKFRDPELESTVSDLGKRIGGFASEEELKDSEYVNNLADMILTFAPHKLLVDTFKKIQELAVNGKVDLRQLIKLLKTARIAELASYGQVADEKIKSIELLENLLEKDAPERDFQEILETAPWLINPAWEPLTNNQTLKNFRKSFESWYKKRHGKEIKTSTDMLDADKKPDFILLHKGNALHIVEIKSPKRIFDSEDWSRMIKYSDSVDAFLKENSEASNDFPKGVVTTLIRDEINIKDKTIKLAIEQLEKTERLVQKTWTDLLSDTKKIHENFIKAREPFKS